MDDILEIMGIIFRKKKALSKFEDGVRDVFAEIFILLYSVSRAYLPPTPSIQASPISFPQHIYISLLS